MNILKVNRVPKNEQALVQMPAIYSKFVEDKIISEQEANDVSQTAPSNASQQNANKVTEKDIKQL